MKKNKDNNLKETIKVKKSPGSKKKKIIFITATFLLATVLGILWHYYVSNNTAQNIVFDDNEVMRVRNEKVTMNEFLLYAADVYQGYNLQDEVKWDSEVTDSVTNKTVTYEETVKGAICEQIRMTKILCWEAQAKDVILSSNEKEILMNNAQTYYSNLTTANVIDEGLTVELIAKFYQENALAQKTYNRITEDYEKDSTDKDITKDEEFSDNKLTDKELYFIEVYHNLSDKYDKKYDYYKSVNWNLLDLISFSALSENSTTETTSAEKITETDIIEHQKSTIEK
jgi:hypothetical protein